jgi:glucose/arabinose dehydrogenase
MPQGTPLSGFVVTTLATGLNFAWAIAFAPDGRLFLPGRNYGWPVIVGRGSNPLYVDPIVLFTPDTCAPSGARFVSSTLLSEWNGDMLFTCLRGTRLHTIRLAASGFDVVVVSEAYFIGTYGRLRDVVVGPDGAVYMLTSNGTDQVLRVGR